MSGFVSWRFSLHRVLFVLHNQLSVSRSTLPAETDLSAFISIILVRVSEFLFEIFDGPFTVAFCFVRKTWINFRSHLAAYFKICCLKLFHAIQNRFVKISPSGSV